MPIVQDGTGTNGGTSGNTSITFSHNSTDLQTGSNRVLVVSVSIRDGATWTVTGVTYGGVALTQLGVIATVAAYKHYLWRLVAPAAGANDVVVSVSNSTRIAANAVTWSGVDQTTPFDTPATNSSAGATSIAAAITVPAGDLGIAGGGHIDNDPVCTMTAGVGTMRSGPKRSSEAVAAGTVQDGLLDITGGAVSPQFNFDQTVPCGIIACNMNAATASGIPAGVLAAILDDEGD